MALEASENWRSATLKAGRGISVNDAPESFVTARSASALNGLSWIMTGIRSWEALGASNRLGPICMTLGGSGRGVQLPPPSLGDQTTTVREVPTGEFGGRHNAVSAGHPWSQSAKFTTPLNLTG